MNDFYIQLLKWKFLIQLPEYKAGHLRLKKKMFGSKKMSFMENIDDFF